MSEGSADALRTEADPWLEQMFLTQGGGQELRASMGAQMARQGAMAGSRLVPKLMGLNP